MVKAGTRTRLIKWVGDPRAVREDGWRVPNWRYENNRKIVTARHTRLLRPGDAPDYRLNPDGTPDYKRPIPDTGIEHEYVFTQRNPIQEMTLNDAMKILRAQGNLTEFKDVTDEAHPEDVVNDIIVVPSKRAESARARA
jgi:hypothetical protein